jgi:hypothetical protein
MAWVFCSVVVFLLCFAFLWDWPMALFIRFTVLLFVAGGAVFLGWLFQFLWGFLVSVFLGSVSSTKVFQQAVACLCALIGAWSIMVTAELAEEVTSKSQAFVLVPVIIYALLAFVPFFAFVYPRLKTSRKSVLLSVSLIEILVLGLFLWAILFSRAAA